MDGNNNTRTLAVKHRNDGEDALEQRRERPQLCLKAAFFSRDRFFSLFVHSSQTHGLAGAWLDGVGCSNEVQGYAWGLGPV